MKSSIFPHLPWNIKTPVARLAETLLDGKIRVYDTTGSNKGHSTWPRTGSQPLGKRAVSILEARCHNGPVWTDRIVQMLSTIHDATTVNTGRKDKNKPGNKETLCCCPIPYICMKDTDGADQYLSYYSILRKPVKWPNVSAKLYTLQDIFVYKTLNTNKKKRSTRTPCMM